MRVLFTLILFIAGYKTGCAEMANLQLTDAQYKALVEMRHAPGPPGVNDLFSGWKAEEIKHAFSLLVPANGKAYHDSAVVYEVCGKVSEQLVKSELPDMNFAVLVSQPSSGHLRENLRTFFQNQLFDFFYNYQLTHFLARSEYIDILQPQAVYKLLKDYKTEEKLNQEIRFIANNSKYLLFN